MQVSLSNIKTGQAGNSPANGGPLLPSRRAGRAAEEAAEEAAEAAAEPAAEEEEEELLLGCI